MLNDIQVEFIVMMQKLLGRISPKNNPMLCPKCRKATLIQEKALMHYLKVASTKFIEGALSSPIGEVATAIPPPKYLFFCDNPKCHSVCQLDVNTTRYKVIGHWELWHGVVVVSPYDKLTS